MCGILGWYNLNSTTEPDSKFFTTGFAAMQHRGPDAQAQMQYGEACALGHLRLSIIDTTEQANMPMESAASSIVFNGEIYNYLELKQAQLKDKTFVTASDTEVLQRGLEKSGVDFLHATNGMFTFALYNKATQALLLGRDRFGVKPLHYLVQDGYLYFASEIKPLIQIKKNPKPNLAAYRNFVQDTATDYDAETFVEGIQQLPKGHYLECQGSVVTIKPWYQGADYKVNRAVFRHATNTVQQFEDLLCDAIAKRMRSDVPVCLTLSGGLDSTVIYTLLKERLKANVQLFTFVNAGSKIDETDKVLRLAASYGDTVEQVKGRPASGVADIQEVLQYLEFPGWSAGSLAYLDIYKQIAARGYKVVIEGHGSDELLGGYPYMLESAIYELVVRGHWLQAKQVAEAYQDTTIWHEGDKPSLINTIVPIVRRGHDDPKFSKTLQGAIDDAFDYRILPIVLRTFDRLTMRSSVESRAPFMDYRVVEFCKQLPLKYKASGLGSKTILRLILKKYHKDFIYEDKRKIGFGMDIPTLFNEPATKQFLQQAIAKFDMLEFTDLKQQASTAIAQPVTWNQTETIWKAAALSLVNQSYGL